MMPSESSSVKPNPLRDVQIEGACTPDSILAALREADSVAKRSAMEEVPRSFAPALSKTTYHVAPSSWGQQVKGLQKYAGSGIVLQTDECGRTAPLIRFTTLFVEENTDCRKRLSGGKKYAEFVNSICPPGRKIGAHSTAEQLFAPVWEAGATGV